MKIGPSKNSSQYSSKSSAMISPLVSLSASSILYFLATCLASSSVFIVSKSTPTHFLTASCILRRVQGGVRSKVLPWYSITIEPNTFFATVAIRFSVISIISSMLPYAWYSSIDVNSGLWFLSIPSLRNILPIS